MSKRTRALIAVALVLVIIAGVAYALTVRANTPTVEVDKATRGRLSVSVVASGKVGSDARYDLYPPSAGTLQTVDVADGQEVVAGQLIATMDPRPLEAQLAQAKAAYQSAVIQRASILAQAPGTATLQAAQVAVDAAQSAYETANDAYEAVKGGSTVPSAEQIAAAEQNVADAQKTLDAAQAAYDDFYNNTYLPAPTPRDPALEAQLAGLSAAVSLARANLAAAQQTLAQLRAAQDPTAAIAAAKAARDQAYSAYLTALAQRDALVKSSDLSGALKAADAGIAAAKNAVTLAEDMVAKTRFVAPTDGVVLFNTGSASSLLGSMTGGAAATLAPGAPVSPATAPFSVVSFTTVDFTANVDEADVVRIKAGMKATIVLDGLPATEFTSEVGALSYESVLTATGGTAFPVTLRFAPGENTVLLGMNGSAEIVVETIGDTLTVPIEALLQDSAGDYVYTVRNGRARKVKVEVGRLTDTAVEVKSALSEGDTVIVSGVSDIRDGDRVRTQ